MQCIFLKRADLKHNRTFIVDQEKLDISEIMKLPTVQGRWTADI